MTIPRSPFTINPMDFVLEQIVAVDWPEVKAIFEEGIATRLATFETEAPEWEEWDQGHLPSCRITAKIDGRIIGWSALSPISSRCVYGGVAEVSVYVGQAEWGEGIGKVLLSELISQSEQAGLWTLQAGIFPENEISIALHKSCGFREVGLRERIGQLDGLWLDTILLERRSPHIS